MISSYVQLSSKTPSELFIFLIGSLWTCLPKVGTINLAKILRFAELIPTIAQFTNTGILSPKLCRGRSSAGAGPVIRSFRGVGPSLPGGYPTGATYKRSQNSDRWRTHQFDLFDSGPNGTDERSCHRGGSGLQVTVSMTVELPPYILMPWILAEAQIWVESDLWCRKWF